MAWRNLWRHRRRTWLTVGAMIFSNLILVFAISLQFGSYQMMIDNSLKSYTGHMQVQREGYNDEPKMRLPNVSNSSSVKRAFKAGVSCFWRTSESSAIEWGTSVTMVTSILDSMA